MCSSLLIPDDESNIDDGKDCEDDDNDDDNDDARICFSILV